MNIDRQQNCATMYPPSVGARMGAIPMISISMENIRAVSSGGNKSRTMALLVIMPMQPPRAINTRIAIKTSILGVK